MRVVGGARIAHWLKGLIASLRNMGDAVRRMGQNIRQLRESLRPVDDMGTRRKRADPANYPKPPERTPDSHMPGGDPVYYRENSTAIGYDTTTMNNFDNARPEPGHHDVVVHGLREGQFQPSMIGSNDKNVPSNYTHPNQVVDAIRANPPYDGGPVRLMSCHSGAAIGPNGVTPAQEVADLLGVPVMAPTDAVGIRLHSEGNEIPRIARQGTWETFYPRGER